FGACVLCHGLGSLRHGVFGQLTGQQQTDGGLDLSGGDGGALVVVSETRCLTADALKDVVDERVHDAHGLRRNTGVRMNLLQDFIHVDSVTLLPGLSALLSSLPGGLGVGLLRALLGRRLCWFRH
ncbi:histone 2, partial [Triplophysa rosa]